MAEPNVDVPIPHASSGIVSTVDDRATLPATREFYRWMVDVTDTIQRLQDEITAVNTKVDDLRQELIDNGTLP